MPHNDEFADNKAPVPIIRRLIIRLCGNYKAYETLMMVIAK